jgi:hypothetical protein
MGFFSSYSGDGKQVVNVEFVLKMMDKLIPPVGFIYMSTSSASPSTIYPGTTWVAWGRGQVPVGVDASQSEFNTVEKTGGEKAHTLTIDELASHSHQMKGIQNGGSTDCGGSTRAAADDAWHDSSTENAGGEQAHNNLQPYVTCYMFKRTA